MPPQPTAEFDSDDLTQWLSVQNIGDLDGRCSHTWCRQNATEGWRVMLPKLVEFYEFAHSHAREIFRDGVGLSLDPVDAGIVDYPRSMPLDSKMGFFGEGFCGLLAKVLELIGRRTWDIPMFLFPLHQAAEEHLFRLIYGDPVPQSIPGRTGNDFLAFCLNNSGRIEAILVGEAKCHQTFNLTESRNALQKLRAEGDVPVSLPQLKRLLEDSNDAGRFDSTIEQIETLLLRAHDEPTEVIPRVDLFVYIYGAPGVVNYIEPRITCPLEADMPDSNRYLHIAEIHVPNVRALVSSLYDNLYVREVHHAVA